MIKKYFAMTIIAASVALAACSDDDDDDGGNSGGEVNNGGETVELTATVSDPAVTVYDVIGGSDAHTTLRAALDSNPELANAADDDANPITVIAPDNTAFDALIASIDGVDDAAGLLALEDGATALRTLQYHVMSGVVDLTDTTAATDTLLVDDGTAAQLNFTGSDSSTSGIAVVDSSGAEIDLAEVRLAPEGNVYTTSTVLTPPAAPVVEPTTPPTTPTGGLGDLLPTGYTITTAALDATYGPGTFESAPWTLFLPNDTTLTAAGVTALSEAQINGHLHSIALDETALAALAATPDGTIQSAGGEAAQTIAVTADASGAILVGGHAVTYIGQVVGTTAAGEPSTGAHVYMIEGILPAAE